MSDDRINQTSFSEEQVLRDQPRSVSSASSSKKTTSDDETQKTATKLKKPKDPRIILIMVLAVLAFVLVLISVLLSFSRGPNGLKATPLPTSEATAQPQRSDEMQKIIDSLENDIDLADPLQNDLPFPPVNFQIHLKLPPATR